MQVPFHIRVDNGLNLILNRKLRYVAAELRCNKAIKWRCICEVPQNNFFDFTAASCFKFSGVISTVTVALKRLCPARPSALQVIPAKRAILLPTPRTAPDKIRSGGLVSGPGRRFGASFLERN
jgi:hypothetical protein